VIADPISAIRHLAGPQYRQDVSASEIETASRDRGVYLTEVGTEPVAGAVNLKTHTSYFANFDSGTISVINDATCSATVLTACGGIWPTVAVGNGPNDVAVDQATDTIYVANQLDDTVSVINGARCNAEVTAGCSVSPPTISAGAGPSSLALDPATTTLYVTDAGPGGNLAGHSVSVIDTATCNAATHAGCSQTPARLHVGPGPFDLDLNKANNTIYVGNTGNNTVSVIDGATCDASVRSGCDQHPPTVHVGTFPFAVAFDSAHDSVYVGTADGGTLSVINGATCNAIDRAGCATHPATVHVAPPGYGTTVDVFMDEANHTAYAAIDPCPCSNSASPGGRGLVAMLNTNTCNGIVTAGCGQRPIISSSGGFPFTVLVDTGADTVYVGLNSNTLEILRADRCNSTSTAGCPRPLPTVAVGADPFAVAVDTVTHTAYVANIGSNSVSVVDTATCNAESAGGCRAVAATVNVGDGPIGVALDQATDTIYVTNVYGNTVSVIDGITCNASDHSGCANTPPTIAVPPGPYDAAVDQATDTVYVSADGAAPPFTGDTVSVINGATCNATRTAGCDQTPPEMTLGEDNPGSPAVDEATDTVYVPIDGSTYMGDTVAVINGAICNGKVHSGCAQVPQNITVGTEPGTAAIDIATDTVYVSNVMSATVSVVDGATCNGMVTSGCAQIPPTVAVGLGPYGVAIDQATEAVVVTNAEYEPTSLDYTVSIIDGARCNARHRAGCGGPPKTVEVGGAPAGVAVDDHTDTAYVVNLGDWTLSVLRP